MSTGMREGDVAPQGTEASESECRVLFDFEIEFANGGGLKGKGFRLDIQGDGISDDELAGYVVRDMRLLMVKSVRILSKAIVHEPHKRPLAAASPQARRRRTGGSR